MEIRCDNMDLCGDIIQALGVDYLGLDYLVLISSTISYRDCAKKLNDFKTSLNLREQGVRRRAFRLFPYPLSTFKKDERHNPHPHNHHHTLPFFGVLTYDYTVKLGYNDRGSL